MECSWFSRKHRSPCATVLAFSFLAALCQLSAAMNDFEVDALPIENSQIIIESMPGKDAQILHDLQQFHSHKNKIALVPVIIISMLVGLVSNSGLAYFFANKLSPVYRTRDALYFRWMVVFDTLICLVVLPYTVAFEMTKIENVYVCKVMELVRHTLIFASHIFLVAYSAEFFRRITYPQEVLYVRKLVCIVLAFSLVCALPALVVFGVNPKNFYFTEYYMSNLSQSFRQELSLTDLGAAGSRSHYYFKAIKFCHFIFNIDPTDKYYIVNKMTKVMYYCIVIGMYIIACIIYISGVVYFLDSKPYLGRDTMFIKIYENQNPIIKDKVEAYTNAQKRKLTEKRLKRPRASHAAHPLKFRGSDPSDVTNSTNKSILKKPADISGAHSSSGTDLDRVYIKVHFQESEEPPHDKEKETKEKDKETRFSKKDQLDPFEKVETTKQNEWAVRQRLLQIEMNQAAAATHIDQSAATEASGNACSVGDVENKEEEEMQGFKINTAHPPLPRVDSLEIAERHSVPHIKSSGEECAKTRKRTLLNVGSCKTALMVLISLDLMVITFSLVLYAAVGERSYVLCLIHFKSIFGFFVISCSHAQLRRVVYRRNLDQVFTILSAKGSEDPSIADSNDIEIM